MSDGAQGRAFEIRLRVDPMTAGALALIALQTVVRFVVVPGSYFWEDDYVHLGLARTLGLTPDFLLRDYNDHLEVGSFFVYWLVGLDAGSSFWLPALTIILLQLVASLLFWRALVALFDDSPAVLVALALYLFTPLTLVTVTWWAAGLEALPLQVAMAAVLLGAVRYLQSGSRRWALVSLAGYVFGLLFWEKAVLVLPLVVAVCLCFVLPGDSLGRRVRALLARPFFWGAHVLVLVGYLALYLSVVEVTTRGDIDGQPFITSAARVIFRMYLPGLFGGPWTTTGAENTLYPFTGNLTAVVFAAMAGLVVVASIRGRGRRAVLAWCLLASYVAVDVALMLVGRSEYLSLVPRDPRYITDSLPVAALAVAAAFTGPAGHRRRGDWEVGKHRDLSVAVAVTSVLVSSSLLTTLQLRQVVQHEYARNFTHGVLEAMDRNPGASIVNTDVPGGVSSLVDYRTLVEAMGAEPTFDQPGGQMYMFDNLATLREVDVIERGLDEEGPVEDCGWRVRSRPVTLAELEPSTVKGQVVRLGYLSGEGGLLHVEVGGREQTLRIEPGLGNAFFVFEGHSGPVRVWITDNSAGACVATVVAGRPWPVEQSAATSSP